MLVAIQNTSSRGMNWLEIGSLKWVDICVQLFKVEKGGGDESDACRAVMYRLEFGWPDHDIIDDIVNREGFS